MAMDRPMDIIGMTRDKIQRYPFSGVKVLSSLQMASGCVCVVIGFVELLLHLFLERDDMALKSVGDSAWDRIDTLTMSATPVWCGVWFCCTGATGLCISRQNKPQLGYYRKVYLTLSILCAALFGPICIGVSVSIAIMYRVMTFVLWGVLFITVGVLGCLIHESRILIVFHNFFCRSTDFEQNHSMSSVAYTYLVAMVVAFFSFNSTVIAVVSASLCCCCSAVEETRVRVLVTDEKPAKEKPVYKTTAKERPESGSPDILSFGSANQLAPIDSDPRYSSSYKKLRNFVLPGSISFA